MRPLWIALPLTLLLLAGCERAQEPAAEPEPEATSVSELPALLPLPGREAEAPDPGLPALVEFETDAGNFVLAIYPNAAPNSAARFLELVETGFYNETPVSRVVPGFVAQFGINWRDGLKDWGENNFDDDPSWFAFEPGTIAFAKAGPDTNSTQVFINYSNNNRLADPQFNFAVFGQVVEGMEVVESFRQVGDPSMGLDQAQLWEDGANYLASLDEKPNMILRATLR